jgi:hypothetical protein
MLQHLPKDTLSFTSKLGDLWDCAGHYVPKGFRSIMAMRALRGQLVESAILLICV